MQQVNEQPVPTIVTADWVRDNINSVAVLDCYWVPFPTGQPHEVQIPGALFFDVEEVLDAETYKDQPILPLPHMLPTAEMFAQWMNDHGITNDDHILLYDHSNGQFNASARIWWTCRTFGHDKVSILEGGFANWPSGVTVPPRKKPDPPRPFVTHFRPENIWKLQDVWDNVNSQKAKMVDARPRGRLEGKDNEPRPLLSGMIPGSKNVGWAELYEKHEGRGDVWFLKSPEVLRALFAREGVDVAKDAIAVTCGSGVTASDLVLALFLLGRTDVPLYDGAWSEWVQHKDTPKLNLQTNRTL